MQTSVYLMLALVFACAAACGERAVSLDATAPADARLDAAPPDSSIDDDAPIFPEASPLPDLVSPDQWFPDYGSLADALALSKWSAVAFKRQGSYGGSMPGGSTSELKGGQVTVTTWILKGPTSKDCKASVSAQQVAPVLVAADKVSWPGVLTGYVPGGSTSCPYPGPTETLSVTLTAKGGGVSTHTTVWCPAQSSTGVKLKLPPSVQAFVDTTDLFVAQACMAP